MNELAAVQSKANFDLNERIAANEKRTDYIIDNVVKMQTKVRDLEYMTGDL